MLYCVIPVRVCLCVYIIAKCKKQQTTENILLIREFCFPFENGNKERSINRMNRTHLWTRLRSRTHIISQTEGLLLQIFVNNVKMNDKLQKHTPERKKAKTEIIQKAVIQKTLNCRTCASVLHVFFGKTECRLNDFNAELNFQFLRSFKLDW